MDTALFFVRWVLGGSLLLLCLWITALNWSWWYYFLARKGPVPSWIPFLGALVGCVGLLVVPHPPTLPYWWVPFVLDWGSLPGTVFSALYWLVRSRRESTPGT